MEVYIVSLPHSVSDGETSKEGQIKIRYVSIFVGRGAWNILFEKQRKLVFASSTTANMKIPVD